MFMPRTRHSAARRSNSCVPDGPRELAEAPRVSEHTLRDWRHQNQVDRHARDEG
jgi:hypothetical protein